MKSTFPILLLLLLVLPVQAQREFGNDASSFRQSKQDSKARQQTTSRPKQRPPQVVVVNDVNSYQRQAVNPKHQMVDLAEELPGVVFDLKYTTSQNFMRQPLYPDHARPWARRDVAERLARVQRDLAKQGYGLKIFDAYRPWSVTKKMWNSRRKLGISARFLAPPWVGSNHNRGVAVDITLVDLKTGKEVEMPTDFDSFSQRAHSSYPHLPAAIKKNRELLKKVMRRHGFNTIRSEWWHFELANAGAYSVLDLKFRDFETPLAKSDPAASSNDG